MTRPNKGRKRRGKQSQPPSRLKLPFRSGRSRSGSYPNPQQPQPAENGITSVAGSSDGWAETQQVKGERASRCYSQGSSRRSTPTWEAWKLFRSSKTHETSRKSEGSSPKSVRPQYTSAPSVPPQSFETWESANMLPFDCFVCSSDGCFHNSGAGTTYQNPVEPNDEQPSFPTPGLILNDVTMLERNLGNVCLGGVFSNYSSHPDECMLESPLRCTQELSLDAEMDIDDSAYYYPNPQHLPGFSTTELAEESGYHNESRLDFIMAAMGRHEERVLVDDFEAMEASDEEDIYNLPLGFFSPYMQVPPRLFPQETKPVLPDAKLVFTEASKQLELYNNRWTSIQQRTATSQPPSIPWPSKDPSSSRENLFRRDMRNASIPSEHLPKFTAHIFFCHAFGFHPLWNSQGDSGFEFGFITGEAKDTTIQKLNGLKNQLKLEKVRWHEDKVKAMFGEEAASDECVKEVWSVVIQLKGQVERELEKLGV